MSKRYARFSIRLLILPISSYMDRDAEDVERIFELTSEFPIFRALPLFVRREYCRYVQHERYRPGEVST